MDVLVMQFTDNCGRERSRAHDARDYVTPARIAPRGHVRRRSVKRLATDDDFGDELRLRFVDAEPSLCEQPCKVVF